MVDSFEFLSDAVPHNLLQSLMLVLLHDFGIKIQYSPDYPTFGYPAFRFIRLAVSERSILLSM
jgi:hypothetical protein